MAQPESGNCPNNLTFGDSAAIALRASQLALQRHHFDPFPQSPPMRFIARALNQLPQQYRIMISDRISASIGHEKSGIDKLDPVAAARWVVEGYPSERYPGCILGAPGLSVVFLSALTGFPFLPQPLLFNARRDMKADDAQAYLDAGKELAEPLTSKFPDIEAIIHYDPVHDRFLIKRLVFMRLKYLTLPPAYVSFIRNKLIPGAPVILADCTYTWLRAEFAKNCFFQLGGLGGFTAQEYIDEIQSLRDYRRDWGAPPDASWRVDIAYSHGPESEWGSSGSFLDDAEDVCRKSGHRPIRVRHNYPGELSARVFELYRHCFQGATAPSDVYIGTFTHIDPRFPVVTGCLPLWMPFITSDSYHFVFETLREWRRKVGLPKPSGSLYITLHPSFCNPPDLVSLEQWRTLFNEYFEKVSFLGIDPGRYPADLGSYVSMYPAIVAAAKKAAFPGTPFRRPTASEMEEILLSV
jgi:hypothetical protein